MCRFYVYWFKGKYRLIGCLFRYNKKNKYRYNEFMIIFYIFLKYIEICCWDLRYF